MNKNIYIDNENLFKEVLKTGVNLFTGAGFSVMPYNENKLPVNDELCDEICNKFKIDKKYGTELSTISVFVSKDEYQKFLRERFTVDGCNEMYFCINNINLKSIITTNIDNIFHYIIKHENKYFLNNIHYYGASKSKFRSIDYIPLHGEVLDVNRPLFFDKFDLSIVDEYNRELFNEMESRLLLNPTLFWGYSFKDQGVLKIITKVLNKKRQDFWIQCHPDDFIIQDVFKKQGVNIIISDTENLLHWIKSNIKNLNDTGSEGFNSAFLKKYSIPSVDDKSIEVISSYDYYTKGMSDWYPILTKQPYETSFVNKIYNHALSNKNTIIVGGKFVGKKTILMQLALKVESNNKLFLNDPVSPEEANFILSELKNRETWIFCAKGILDAESMSIFFDAPNIKLVVISEDYAYESARHLLRNNEKIYLGELDYDEAQRIFDHIPQNLKIDKFKFKDSEDEKYSMWEFILKNIKDVFSYDRIKKILLSIKKKSQRSIKTVALATYLYSCDSVLSTDIIFSFFDLKNYSEVQSVIDEINSILNEYSIGMYKDLENQDYYILRSKFFAEYAKEVFSKNIEFKNIYADVIKYFTYNVSTFKIYKYNIFKRKAYDATLFYSLFNKNAINIYEFLYDKFQNAYILQQMSLLLSKLKRHNEAFNYIDKAYNKLPNNFSIKNSMAIITFEAYNGKQSEFAKMKMRESMKMLENCYLDDKRKVYHAQKYAEFALILHNDYHINEYINQAKRWINEVDSNSDITRNIRLQLSYL